MRKVTKPEIEKLYKFTRKHYVEYYDLQTELVDHLANGMEAHWEENPHLEFEENLNLEFKKFGIFGFSDVVEKRQNAMTKKYYKLIWSETKQILRQPKFLFIVFALILLCRFVLELNYGTDILSGASLVFFIVALIKQRKTFPKRKKENKRVFLLEEIIRNTGGAAILFIFPFNGLSFFSNSSGTIENGIAQWVFAFLMTAIYLMAYICFWTLPNKKEEILEKAYPERAMLK